MEKNINRISSNSGTLAVLLLGLALSGSALAQRRPDNPASLGGAQKQQPLSLNCHASPSYGSGQTRFALCITNHGNILKIESPAGHDPMIKEGYRLCYDNASAYDNGVSESGWGPSTISGSVNLPLTITRSTTDGKFRLVQVFSRNNIEREVVVEMRLTNTSAGAINNVFLDRYFDADLFFDATDVYNTTLDSSNGQDIYGLVLTTLSPTVATVRNGEVHDINSFDWTGAGCGDPGVRTPFVGNGVGLVNHAFNSIPKNAAKIIKYKYSRF